MNLNLAARQAALFSQLDHTHKPQPNGCSNIRGMTEGQERMTAFLLEFLAVRDILARLPRRQTTCNRLR